MTPRNHQQHLVGAVAVLAAICSLLWIPVAAAQSDLELQVDGLDISGAPEIGATITAPASAVGIDPSRLRFRVGENGERVDVTVRTIGEQNLQVVLLIDTSGSMRGEPLAAAKTAAAQFVQTMPDVVPIAVLGFGATAAQPTLFSADRSPLTTAIEGLQASGETALYDALTTAAQLFDPDESGRRVAVVLTDGGDTVSSAGLADAVAALTESNVEVNVVSLVTSESDPAALAELVSARDGTVVAASDPVGLTAAYERVAALLANRFSLEWSSSNSGPTDLEIRLTAPDGFYVFSSEIDLPSSKSPTVAGETTVVPPSLDASLNASSFVPETTTGKLMMVGLALMFLAIATATISIILAPPGNRQLAREFKFERPSGPQFSKPIRRLIAWFERRLASLSAYDRLALALDRAAVRLNPAEFSALLFGGGIVAVFFGAAIRSIGVGLLLAIVVAMTTWLVLKVRTERRRNAFAEQLDTTLTMMAGSLRAGYGINQAVDTVATETEAPTSEEFQRVTTEVRLGKSLPQSLRSAAERVECEDFEWAVQAIEINNEVGGNLAEVLENVAGTIRARTTVKRRIRALSAEGRISALVLYLLPFVMFVWIRLTNPEYVGEMTGSSLGQRMLILAAFLLIVGAVWLRRIIRLVF